MITIEDMIERLEAGLGFAPEENDLLINGLKLLKRRFSVYASYDGYENLVLGAYPSIEVATSAALENWHKNKDTDYRIAIIDRIDNREVWDSGQIAKELWKYNSLTDLDKAGMVNHDQYLILEQIPWDAYKNEANEGNPRLGIAKFLKHWSELQRMLVEFQEDSGYCQELKDTVRDGKITLSKGMEFKNVPLSDQPHCVEILVSGGNVVLSGFEEPASPRWQFGLWQTETMSYDTDAKFNEWKPCDLLWCVAMPCTPQGYQLGKFKNGSFGKFILKKVLQKETFEEAIAELLRYPEFKPERREHFTAERLRKALKIG